MSAVKNSTRISKKEWAEKGGLSNPKLWRRMVGGRWQYFRTND